MSDDFLYLPKSLTERAEDASVARNSKKGDLSRRRARCQQATSQPYTLNNWSALVRYTEAGRLAIDNNVVEREMKQIVNGRKNQMTVGASDCG